MKNRDAVQSIVFEDLRNLRNKHKDVDEVTAPSAAAYVVDGRESAGVNVIAKPKQDACVVPAPFSHKSIPSGAGDITKTAKGKQVDSEVTRAKMPKRTLSTNIVSKEEHQNLCEKSNIDSLKEVCLGRADVKKLTSSKGLKKIKIKNILGDEIRRLLGKQRVSIPVGEGKGKKPISRCNVEELEVYLLQLIRRINK